MSINDNIFIFVQSCLNIRCLGQFYSITIMRGCFIVPCEVTFSSIFIQCLQTGILNLSTICTLQCWSDIYIVGISSYCFFIEINSYDIFHCISAIYTYYIIIVARDRYIYLCRYRNLISIYLIVCCRYNVCRTSCCGNVLTVFYIYDVIITIVFTNCNRIITMSSCRNSYYPQWTESIYNYISRNIEIWFYKCCCCISNIIRNTVYNYFPCTCRKISSWCNDDCIVICPSVFDLCRNSFRVIALNERNCWVWNTLNRSLCLIWSYSNSVFTWNLYRLGKLNGIGLCCRIKCNILNLWTGYIRIFHDIIIQQQFNIIVEFTVCRICNRTLCDE